MYVGTYFGNFQSVASGILIAGLWENEMVVVQMQNETVAATLEVITLYVIVTFCPEPNYQFI